MRWWLPAIVWAALIAVFSSDSFSADNTSHFIVPLLKWLLPSASPATLHLLHHYIRKLGHLSEYFVLSIWVFRAIRGRLSGWRVEWAITALVASAGWAGLDELHQAFVPSRGPSMHDVLIDVCGAAVAQVLVGLVSLFRSRRMTPAAAAQ